MKMNKDEYAAHYLSKLRTYIDDVLNDKRVVGKKEKQAVQRYLIFIEKYDYREGELKQRLRLFTLRYRFIK